MEDNLIIPAPPVLTDKLSIRNDLLTKPIVNSSVVNQKSFYQNDDHIFEVIFNKTFVPETQFAVYNKLTKQVSYKPEVLLEVGKILRPHQLDLIKDGTIRLPTCATEYSDEQELLAEIEAFVHFYLDLPHPFYLRLVSHYILLTWVYDKLTVVPYLRALGDYGSGKTRFAQAVGSLCYKPLFLAGATSDSFIFRMIELFKGTLVINELERVNTDLASQIVNILNNGYEKGLYIGRVEGEKKREPKVFDVFSPKIITSRKPFKDLALESRILSIPMKPTKRQDIPPLLDDIFWDSAQDLRDKLLMYRFRNLNSPEREDKSVKFTSIEPRLKQTLLPLLYVTNDDQVVNEFISFAIQFQEQIYADRSFETDSLVAEKLVELLENNSKVVVKEVADGVNLELEDKEKLSSKSVGKKIRDFGYKTKKVQGKFQIIPNQTATQYLKERYNLNNFDESLPNPPSLPSDSGSKVDLVDKESVEGLVWE